MSYIFTFAIALIGSLILTPITRKLMLKLGILAQPNASRWHRRSVALMGGIAIFASFILAALVSTKLAVGFDGFGVNYIILLGGTVTFILGFWDDIRGTYPKLKFAAQCLIALAMVCLGIKSKILPSGVLNISLTLLWIVGLTNALNLLDNMDGLSSGVTSIAAMTIFGISIQKGEPGIALLALALAGSCLGFLFFNFKPAKIFMGDCGSLFLGFTLAVLSIRAGWQHASNIFSAFLVPIIALSVPIFDTTLVAIQRLTHNKMPWHGGKDHSSHRLVSLLGGSERGAVLILYGLGILSGIGALIALKSSLKLALIITGVLGLGMIIFGIQLAKVPCYDK